ncbi:hypothetical protein M527_15250 [Sphingobium indicum IP26]|nr:hypothetical protein M527_15250 [Sphingobium indicum IP26]
MDRRAICDISTRDLSCSRAKSMQAVSRRMRTLQRSRGSQSVMFALVLGGPILEDNAF